MRWQRYVLTTLVFGLCAGCSCGTGTTSDSGSPDSGRPGTDSGTPFDGGTSDGGGMDAGMSDAGMDGGTGACLATAPGPTRGSAIALTSDDSTLVVVNPDAASVTVMSVSYADGEPKMTVLAELHVGNEPSQVAIDACNRTAYVVLRQDQKVVEITNLESAPALGRSVSVGSEPTALALTPNNTRLYVSNWVDGTLNVIDPVSFTVTATVDLNAPLAATGLLGPDVMAAPRAALAHPRGIAITNNGDTSDADETVYVTEWFAVRTAPESATGTTSDTNHKGLLYAVPVATGSVTTRDLPPVPNTGFNDAKGQTTGCFPNQVAAVTIQGTNAFVTSTCASPVGPTGVFQKGACQLDAQCAGGLAGSCVNGSCKGSCVQDSDCGANAPAGICNVVGGGSCGPLTGNAKTTTHPALTVVDLTGGTGPTTSTLDTLFSNGSSTQLGTPSTRMPLLPMDIAFKNASFAYVVGEGADGLFRLTMAAGAITKVGSAANNFIDMRSAADPTIRLPIGVAISTTKAFAFVADLGTRDVDAIDLNTQAIALGAANDLRITPSSALPTAGSAQATVLAGKRAFVTGLGRWSLNGAAWGSCAACHLDGLSDGVTWYFARGPRQTISLDGTFNKADSTDQRILNWTGIFDEIPDLEGNVRGISGGVGALVSTVSSPPVPSDRINLLTQTPQQLGLQGSSTDIATPDGGANHTVIPDWQNITAYVQQIRSPRAPTNLVAVDVAAGQVLFESAGQGNCIACHAGQKWTYSKVFYTPNDVPNDAFGSAAPTSLSNTSWLPATGFPASLRPSATAGKQDMRSGTPGSFEQLQCVLRPVGTIVANGAVPTGVSPAAVNVLELRQDMVTGAQGAGGTNANDFTVGFNPPALLGLAVGAPYFHAGNARSLEESLSATFTGHFQSPVAAVFQPTAQQVKQLTAFLLSVDGSTPGVPIPAVGPNGGDICHYP